MITQSSTASSKIFWILNDRYGYFKFCRSFVAILEEEFVYNL